MGEQEQGVWRFAGVVEMCTRQRCLATCLMRQWEQKIQYKSSNAGKSSYQTWHPLRYQNEAVTGQKAVKKQAFFSSLLRKLPPGAVLLIAPCLSSASWGLKEVQQSARTWLAQRCWLSTSLEAAHFSVQLVPAHFTYTSPAAEYAAGYTARAISWCFIK